MHKENQYRNINPVGSEGIKWDHVFRDNVSLLPFTYT